MQYNANIVGYDLFLSSEDDNVSVDYVLNGGIVCLEGNDIIKGTTPGSIIIGLNVYGSGGDDRLLLDLGVVGVGGNNRFMGGIGYDTLEIRNSGNLIQMNNFGGSILVDFINGTTVSTVDVERFVIQGAFGNDRFIGGTGDDWFDGRGGLDAFHGSAGNDGYVFDTVGERVIGELAAGGNDTIWSTVSVNLNYSGNVENLRLQSGDIDGTGNELANLITGSTGANRIAGGVGNDSLYGKGGADTFLFAEHGSANKDSVWDFGSDDKILLDAYVFGGVGVSDGTLAKEDFVIGARATADHAQIIYNKSTGNLSFDPDGRGLATAQDIAFIGKNLAFFDHTDILIA